MTLDQGSVFEAHTRANHKALLELRDVFQHLGFCVIKKIDKEDTLRVYPERLHKYPLLNPRFVRRRVRGLTGRSFLELSVWSKGDDLLERRLSSYPSSNDSRYVANTKQDKVTLGTNVLHGWFYFRVRLLDKDSGWPDLNMLATTLKHWRDALSSAT